jgi:hypothetical protein
MSLDKVFIDYWLMKSLHERAGLPANTWQSVAVSSMNSNTKVRRR